MGSPTGKAPLAVAAWETRAPRPARSVRALDHFWRDRNALFPTPGPRAGGGACPTLSWSPESAGLRTKSRKRNPPTNGSAERTVSSLKAGSTSSLNHAWTCLGETGREAFSGGSERTSCACASAGRARERTAAVRTARRVVTTPTPTLTLALSLQGEGVSLQRRL